MCYILFPTVLQCLYAVKSVTVCSTRCSVCYIVLQTLPCNLMLLTVHTGVKVTVNLSARVSFTVCNWARVKPGNVRINVTVHVSLTVNVTVGDTMPYSVTGGVGTNITMNVTVSATINTTMCYCLLN